MWSDRQFKPGRGQSEWIMDARFCHPGFPWVADGATFLVSDVALSKCCYARQQESCWRVDWVHISWGNAARCCPLVVRGFWLRRCAAWRLLEDSRRRRAGNRRVGRAHALPPARSNRARPPARQPVPARPCHRSLAGSGAIAPGSPISINLLPVIPGLHVLCLRNTPAGPRVRQKRFSASP